MSAISIIFVIAGAVLMCIFMGLFTITQSVLLSQKNWDEFYEEAKKQNLPFPEEVLYNKVVKLRDIGIIGLATGLLLLVAGLLLLK